MRGVHECMRAWVWSTQPGETQGQTTSRTSHQHAAPVMPWAAQAVPAVRRRAVQNPLRASKHAVAANSPWKRASPLHTHHNGAPTVTAFMSWLELALWKADSQPDIRAPKSSSLKKSWMDSSLSSKSTSSVPATSCRLSWVPARMRPVREEKNRNLTQKNTHTKHGAQPEAHRERHNRQLTTQTVGGGGVGHISIAIHQHPKRRGKHNSLV
jgi:hypothetical protein